MPPKEKTLSHPPHQPTSPIPTATVAEFLFVLGTEILTIVGMLVLATHHR